MRLWRGVVLAFLFLACPAAADDAPFWQKATDAAKSADADVVKSGLAGIAPHVAELESALADGVANFPPKPGPDGKAIVLVDGPSESLMVLMAAASKHQTTTALASPYPEIGLLLALYY